MCRTKHVCVFTAVSSWLNTGFGILSLCWNLQYSFYHLSLLLLATNYLFNVFQGPLEKSLQNSVVSERQRNVEHKVSAIKNSAQVPFLSCVLSLPTWFLYTHTWTIFELVTSANRHTIHFPFFQGHLPRLTTRGTPGSLGVSSCLGSVWELPILKLSHSSLCELQADAQVQ